MLVKIGKLQIHMMVNVKIRIVMIIKNLFDLKCLIDLFCHVVLERFYVCVADSMWTMHDSSCYNRFKEISFFKTFIGIGKPKYEIFI